MDPRAFVQGTPFSPETGDARGETFDQMRARIAPVLRHVPHEIKTARLRRTEAMQSIAVATLKSWRS